MVELLVLITSVLICLTVGASVFARNPQNAVNRLYGAVTTCLVAYPVFNYLSLQTNNRLGYIRLVMCFSTLSAAGIYYLIWAIREGSRGLSDWLRAGLLFTGVIAVADFTSLVFKGLSSGSNPVPIPNFGAGFFLLQFVLFVIGSIVTLFRRIKRTRGAEKQQSIYMLVGVIPMLIFTPITSFVMPLALKNDSLVFLSPVYGAFFVLMIGYAIVRHRLFDIRSVVARTLAYILSLAALGALFIFSTFAFTGVLFGASLNANGVRMVDTVLAIALAFLFAPLRKLFDKLTARLFFHDAYDTQVFLDDFNKLAVTTYQLVPLLEQSADIINKTLKSTYSVFIVRAHKNDSWRVIGAGEHIGFQDKDMKALAKAISHVPTKIIVTDDLDDSHTTLRSSLQEKNVGVAVLLSADNASENDSVGYLVLGPKRNGGSYTSQDLKVVEIVANELVIVVQNSFHFEEIQAFTATLQGRVDKATSQLRRSNHRLRELDSTKDDFISMASHQLRTPLTSVKGYLSMVLDGDAGELNEKQRKLLDQAFRSSQQMVFLISDLLNLSRLNTGKFIIEPSQVDLGLVVQAEVEQLDETAKSRGVTLLYNKPASFPELMLDETKTHQVVMNFIDNAIYYTPSGGTVTVTLRETPTAVEYMVKDNGIGVPKNVQHKLFTKFYRAENAQKARPDGTGLGLFMAKKVIVAQGGSILFDSEEGKGSTFGFRFSKAGHQISAQNAAPTIAR